MTDGVLNVIEDFTGYKPTGCPWRAFFDPLVERVVRAYAFFESGQLAWSEPHPSHRLVDGMSFYHRIDGMIHGKQLRQEQEQWRAARG